MYSFRYIKRLGHVEEIASLLAFCASDKAGYLTGVDIICDGGCVAGKTSR
jgi:NAD(P)-dependent dehydrogenase (short-subunit alcohol dehydrogenase family)